MVTIYVAMVKLLNMQFSCITKRAVSTITTRNLTQALPNVKEISDSSVTSTTSADKPSETFLRLPPLPSPRELLKLYKIRAQRQLSQNFILDSRISNKIVTSTGNVKDCFVCEVGPGPGNITRSILQNSAKYVIVVEKDRRFLPALELLADASEGRLKIILGDILDLNLENILPKDLSHEWTALPPPLYLIGNLPFNISTPLIIKWLKQCSTHSGPFVHGRSTLSLTFQKEVGDRIVAKPGIEGRCRLSVFCQYLCHVDNLFTIPGRAFFPKPEVDVSVVRFVPRIIPQIKQPFDLVEKVVTTIFQHRQKFCLYGLKLLFPKEHPELVHEILQRTKVNPEKRSFELEMEEFKALCDVYSEMCNRYNNLQNYKYQVHKEKEYLLNDEKFNEVVVNK